MKKALILVASFVLVIALTIMGTVAYLTDRDSKVNVFTVGDVEIELSEQFIQGSELMPGKQIEKIPTITNTGDSDAWVWLTFSIPSALDNAVQGTEQGSDKNIIHWNPIGATVEGYVNDARVAKAIQQGLLPEGTTAADILATNSTWNVFNSLGQGQNFYTETIDGVDYNTYVLLYNKALEANESTLTGIYNIYLDARVDYNKNDNKYYLVENGVATEIKFDIAQTKIIISAYAVQKDNIANVNDAYAAYGKQWGANGSAIGNIDVVYNTVSDDASLENALMQNNDTIVISLDADVTYDVAAWANNAMGGTAVKNIIIDGNGHTVNFYQTNSDWNNIVTNGATLTITDAHITNSGRNDGPWNRHDLNFACDVILNDVTSDKALAFKAGATLRNVTINDKNTSDTYAIWIQPKGQNIDIDGLVIDMLDCSDGRGIKIDEQYISAPEKVTLTVKNAIFKTEEKSAILVKSIAGADIYLENVDISAVAADSTNAVWVDEASKDYAALVTVNGGSVIVEP